MKIKCESTLDPLSYLCIYIYVFTYVIYGSNFLYVWSVSRHIVFLKSLTFLSFQRKLSALYEESGGFFFFHSINARLPQACVRKCMSFYNTWHIKCLNLNSLTIHLYRHCASIRKQRKSIYSRAYDSYYVSSTLDYFTIIKWYFNTNFKLQWCMRECCK